MSGNSFGTLFRFTTFGESHGPAIGCVIDGVPPLIALAESDLQLWLDRRKPGQNRFTTQRREADLARILSGVFEGMTTGTPIGVLIENTDQRSADYGEIADQFRPGHADYVYQAKYGIRDHRGGGRSSARETAMRVAAGAVARKILDHLVQGGVKIRGALVQMGADRIDPAAWDWEETEQNPFWCPDKAAAARWESLLDQTRKSGSSLGGVIELTAENVPVGLGEPVYDKLDADIAKALMSINAVKGVEIGDGFASAALRGEDNADEMRMREEPEERQTERQGKRHVGFLSNHAGGILGGISTGQPIIARLAVKPTSSILTPRQSVDKKGNDIEIATKGRHDPCVAIRGVPVAEAMLAVVLADHLLRHRSITGK
jgi:chorismate synthase